RSESARDDAEYAPATTRNQRVVSGSIVTGDTEAAGSTAGEATRNRQALSPVVELTSSTLNGVAPAESAGFTTRALLRKSTTVDSVVSTTPGASRDVVPAATDVSVVRSAAFPPRMKYHAIAAIATRTRAAHTSGFGPLSRPMGFMRGARERSSPASLLRPADPLISATASALVAAAAAPVVDAAAVAAADTCVDSTSAVDAAGMFSVSSGPRAAAGMLPVYDGGTPAARSPGSVSTMFGRVRKRADGPTSTTPSATFASDSSAGISGDTSTTASECDSRNVARSLRHLSCLMISSSASCVPVGTTKSRPSSSTCLDTRARLTP